MSILLRQMALDSPLGLWPLDETSGTTAFDRSGNGRNGTYTGGCTLGGALNQFPRSVLFDGTSGYVDCGYLAAWDVATFTIEGWAAPSSVSGPVMLSRRTTTVYSWEIALASAGTIGQLLGRVNQNGPPNAQSSGSMTTALTHYAMTYDVANIILYVNGVEINRQAYTTALTTGSAPLNIGRRAYTGGEAYTPGRMAWVGFYGTALSATRIKEHYLAGLGMGVVVG